jgi:UDP-N-acetylglucosamine 1-carboxyvinyltransferase
MNIRIKGGVKLSGEITPSGSKNSVVALIPASILFTQPVTLTNVPEITDVERLVALLTQMGSQINWDKTACTLSIDNSKLKYDSLEMKGLNQSKGIKGTSLLWGPMLARFGKTEIDELPGGCTLGNRPLDAHYQAFADLGVTVLETNGGAILDGQKTRASKIELLETSVTATENAVMLATGIVGTTVIGNAACEPHVQDLCNFLNQAGANITGIGSNIITVVGGQTLKEISYRVISDHYEIGTFLALGALTGGEIRVNHAIPQYFNTINREFAKFGIKIEYEGETAVVRAGQQIKISKTRGPMIVRAQPWPALPVDMLPLYIPLALAAPFGQALFHNWMYEAGLFWTSELSKLGANIVMCDPHRVLITGGNKLKGTTLEAPYIIRATISMIMAGLIAEGETTILNADAIHRGHPHFVENLKKLGANIEEV